MTILLVFDTETTDLPPDGVRNVNLKTINKWPHIVQFSYVLYNDETNRLLKTFDRIVKLPENVVMSKSNIAIHGITNERMKEKGVSLLTFLDEFMIDFVNADKIICHHRDFDIKMVMVEILRKITYELTYFHAECYQEYFDLLNSCNKYVCTMRETVDLCAIERINSRGPYLKFPSLSELHFKLYNIVPHNLHNSLYDVLVCLRCYCQLYNNIDILEKNIELNLIFQEKLL